MKIARTLFAVAASAALLASGTTLGAVAASPALAFTRIQYDPSGPDRPTTNRQLDREWVTIKNTSGKARQLDGLRVHDAQHHVYIFGALLLQPGKSVKLHTGPGKNTGTDVYWQSKNYIWNNDGDTATLATSAGDNLDSCRWTADGSGAISC